MQRYPVDKFPEESLRPEIVARHEAHLEVLKNEIEDYISIGHRSSTLYDWALRLFENLGLSTVQTEYLDSLAITKTRLVMFIVLIDDPVDNVDKRNFKLFEELVKIPYHLNNGGNLGGNQSDTKYFELAQKVWSNIISEIKKYPDYDKYKDAFYFDLKQLINSIEYSRFVNTYPNAANMMENEVYVHHGMFVLIQTDLDLMCSKGFDDKELSSLRELSYISQKMARIGNLLNTYTRELLESDMSSEALVKFQKEFGWDFRLKVNRFLNKESRYIKFEEKLLEEWEQEYSAAKRLAAKIKSIDKNRFIEEREFIQKAYRMKSDYW